MKSGVIRLCTESLSPRTRERMAALTPAQLAFADEVYAMCERHYGDGGDVVVETMEPWEIVGEFKSLADARSFCGLKIEQAMNYRWGEDDDPEVERQRNFDTNWRE